MTRGRAGGWTGGVRLLAVVLALAVRVLVPPGYMPSAGAGFMLAICTGQGMRTVEVRDPPPGQSPADGDAAAKHCPFQDDGPCPPPTLVEGVVPPPADYGVRLAALPADLAPGRGLAAPPPPARGPPPRLA